MYKKRQAHGIVKQGEYVYVCGGLRNYYLEDSCERFCISDQKWYSDVPNLNEYKFSMTMVAVESYLYAFGGATAYYDDTLKQLTIERLDTSKLKHHSHQ